VNVKNKIPRLLISYDLRKPNDSPDNYKALYAEFKSLGAKQIQDSVWAVRTNLTARDIFARVQIHLHLKDRLLVAYIDGFRSRRGINRISLI